MATDSSPGSPTLKASPPITVISKTTGWLTVDPETLDRKHAIEKDTKINIRNTSKLAPPWMITDQVRDEKRFRMFKPLPVIGHNVNLEPKRVLLGDATQIRKSIFNVDTLRHNVVNLEEIGARTKSKGGLPKFQKEFMKPSRLIEWEESPNK